MLLLWDFMHSDQIIDQDTVPSMETLQFEPIFPEIALRGLSRAIPDLATYIRALPRSTTIDGGYYTKTMDGLPLVGPWTEIEGYHLVGGLGGYGLMAAAGVGHVLARHVCQEELTEDPDVLQAIHPSRMFHSLSEPNEQVLHL